VAQPAESLGLRRGGVGISSCSACRTGPSVRRSRDPGVAAGSTSRSLLVNADGDSGPDRAADADRECGSFQEDVVRAGLRMYRRLRDHDAEFDAVRRDISEVAWLVRELADLLGDTVPPDLVARVEELVG
jgi:hypothetical protein